MRIMDAVPACRKRHRASDRSSLAYAIVRHGVAEYRAVARQGHSGEDRWRSLQVASLDARDIAGRPERHMMRHGIQHGTAVLVGGARDRPRYADEFHVERAPGGGHERISVSAEFDEGEVRRDVGIARGERLGAIAGGSSLAGAVIVRPSDPCGGARTAQAGIAR
jgi:hypothetical protein